MEKSLLITHLRLLIDNFDRRTFMPQNKEYINTTEPIKLIAKTKGKKLRLIKSLDGLLSWHQ